MVTDMGELSHLDELEAEAIYIIREVAAECEKPVGEWNEADITCKGGKITVYINGELQNEATSDYKNGYIALQSEGGPIEFRNIYLTSVE